jgi:hypothetical protein
MLDAWYGALVVELKEGVQARTVLERPPAAALANALSVELARHLDGLDGLGLCWMAACFDVAQLLRPQFPIYTELRQMYQAGLRDPLAEPQVMTLCALRGVAPSPVLQPDPALAGGSLLYLPLVVIGDADRMPAVRALLEDRLLDEGLVDARSARMVIEALEAPIEHARLLSRDDLCAITAANLEHAGLPSVWQVLEIALFLPERTIDLRGDDGLRWSVIDAVAHLHLSLSAAISDPSTLQDLPEFMQRVRQALALLNAHAVNWRILPSSADSTIVIEQDEAGFWIEWIGAPADCAQVVRIVDERGALLWLQLEDAAGLLRGCAVPLDAAGFAALRQRLSAAGTIPAQRVQQYNNGA